MLYIYRYIDIYMTYILYTYIQSYRKMLQKKHMKLAEKQHPR